MYDFPKKAISAVKISQFSPKPDLFHTLHPLLPLGGGGDWDFFQGPILGGIYTSLMGVSHFGGGSILDVGVEIPEP